MDSAAKAAKWKKLFLSYDKDKSGTITFKELRDLIRKSLHLSENACPDSDLKIIFERLDEDGSGAIEFSEFCTFVQAKKKGSQDLSPSIGRSVRLAMSREKVRDLADLRDLFEKWDLDKDNTMSNYELSRFFREVLRLSQHEVSEFHIKKLHQAIDTDNTGSISQDEFLGWVQENVDFSKGRHGLVGGRFGGVATRDSAHLDGDPRFGSTLPSLAPVGQMVSTAGSEADHGSSLGKGKSRPNSTPCLRPGGVPQAALGGRRTYLSIPGAERLNHVEQRLFEAGFDVRGGFFKVSDHPEGPSHSRTGGFRSTTSGSLVGGRTTGGSESRGAKKFGSSADLFRQMQPH